MLVKCYTDGACSYNPGPGGYAALLCMKNETIKISGGEKETTNNRMELKAVVEALSKVLNMIFQDDVKIEKLEIISDSAYVVNSVKQNWLETWKKNGFKNSKGEDIKNIDLWLKFDEQKQSADFIGLELEFTKIKGHSGNYFNEMVDKIAKSEVSKII